MTWLSVLRRSFRLRLALVFVLVIGVSCGALALSTFLLSRSYRVGTFRERARREAQLHIFLLPRPLTLASASDAARVFDAVGGEDVLFVTAEGQQVSSSALRLDDVPARLRTPGAKGGTASVADSEGHYLVVGNAVDGGARLFFFFDERELTDGIRRLGLLLLVGWMVIVAIAALVGQLMARGTLAPVRAAGDAARAMAEGLLDTRLPADTDDEFGRWARYFNEMASALEAKIADLSEAHLREVRFTADVAHELRTPLAAAINAAAVVEPRIGEIPEGVRRPIELMIADLRRLRRLVLELLELSRLDAGQEAVVAEVLSLSTVALSVRRSNGWEGEIVVEPAAVWVLADRRRIERIVVNLLSNAVEHGRPPITLRVRAEEEHGVLEVHDEGGAIAAEVQEAIFERFFKADASRSASGLGLGLAIAAENARSMGGSISVESSAGAGTTFTLRLPLADATDAAEGEAAALAETAPH